MAHSSLLDSSDRSVETLEDHAHLEGVVLLLFVPLVLLVVYHVLLWPVLKLVSLLLRLEASGCHDPHDLLVVVEDGQPRQFRLV